MMIPGAAFFSTIRSVSRSKPETERCGFLLKNWQGGLEVEFCNNVAHKPDVSFEIAMSDYLAAHTSGRLFAVWHSHTEKCEYGAELSPEDIAASERSTLPYLVYSVRQDAFDFYRPKTETLPLENRDFIVGVQDCVQLVVDYYWRTFGFRFRFFERGQRMLIDGFGAISDYIVSHDLKETEKLELGAILLLSISDATHINHAGVYSEHGIILHQLLGQMSCRNSMKAWAENVKMILVRK